MVLALLSIVLPSQVQSAATATARTSWGDPDLQGIWSNGTRTTLARPRDLGDKEFFATVEEAEAYGAARRKAFDDRPQRGYDVVFNEGGPWVKSLRTSLIISPKDGQVPPYTDEGKRRVALVEERDKLHPADGPEDRWLAERCIYYGATGPGMVPEPYNSQYLIVQSPGYFTITAEQGHTVRIIPLDDGPRLPASERTWMGESRGHWEGETLVVESTNMRYAARTRWTLAQFNTQSDENLRVVERFTRTARDTIMYQATIDDPTVYVSPWTFEYNMYPSAGPMLEVACHEGNYGMLEILSGARATEAKRK